MGVDNQFRLHVLSTDQLPFLQKIQSTGVSARPTSINNSITVKPVLVVTCVNQAACIKKACDQYPKRA